jgi:hypothetical protein
MRKSENLKNKSKPRKKVLTQNIIGKKVQQ